ncbi:hypothetical protein CTAYLR_010206 [Chrysophaeum taylorii]|uniref:Calcineurin-like phosphoesterase domain-containing protein n=1 Tax=Chrysophaeum taylorii TaxID=2483200 RepID=A0AAD7UKE1_9STRA|nr:hypothetical protein CTAYLR_010206 [Chrysophaeum taylorii]
MLALTLSASVFVLPSIPAVLRLLPPRVSKALMHPIRASPVANLVYTKLCWVPFCRLRARWLRAWLTPMLRTKCVYVDWPDVRVLDAAQLPEPKGLRVVSVSDTHAQQRTLGKLPDGDVLIHAGDLLRRDSRRTDARARLRDVGAWLRKQPHRHKLVVAGNHDFSLEAMSRDEIEGLLGARYCEDEGLDIENARIFLSPFSASNSARSENRAFQSPEREAKFRAAIAQETRVDLLVTHGPPRGHLDSGVGSVGIADAVRAHAPRYHIFGHQHNCAGVAFDKGTVFVNASNCDGFFALVKPAIVVDIQPGAELGNEAHSTMRLDLDHARARLHLIKSS